MEKKILDVTCGSKTIWFNKNHPAAIYCDKRRENFTLCFGKARSNPRKCVVDPDILCDFTNLPFPDNSFSLVVFDPPHLIKLGDEAWMAKKYGKLDDNWPSMLHDGFRECMRVLKPDGVLVFKWSECDIPAAEVWKAIGEKPLFGHHSGKKSQTFWAVFMKLEPPTAWASDKLRACPFCGGAADITRFLPSGGYVAYCTECGAHTEIYRKAYVDAIAGWNKRGADA